MHTAGRGWNEAHAHALRCALHAGPAELSVVLCSDEHITELNRTWRGKAEPTDVLSFEMQQDGIACPVRVLGDLVISLDTAERQAEEQG
jgi:rRNA maturation RNase YbeY